MTRKKLKVFLTPPGFTVGALAVWSVLFPAYQGFQAGGTPEAFQQMKVALIEVTLHGIPFGLWFLAVLFAWGSGASLLARTLKDKVPVHTRAGYFLMAYTPVALLIHGIMRGVIRLN